MTLRTWSHGVLAVVLVGILAGCGGSGASSASATGSSGGTQSGGSAPSGNGGNTSAPPVTGIATPKSVSVVTAN